MTDDQHPQSGAGHVLVTGANGFVGSNIVDVLLQHGWRVTALDLNFDNPAVEAWRAQDVAFVTGSVDALNDQRFDASFDASFDAIIHGAAITAAAEQIGHTPEENFRANIEPALKISEYAAQHAVKRVVFVSSTGVYSETPLGPYGEDVPAAPLGTYAVAKYAIERMTATLHALYQRDIITIRLGNIYGPNEYVRPSRPRMSVIGRMIRDAVHDNVVNVYVEDELREWTYAPDVGAALDALLKAETLNHAVYHIASGQIANPLQISQLIKRTLPEVHVKLQQGQSPNTRHLSRFGTPKSLRLLKDTGFSEWTPLEAGIQRTIAELQTRGLTHG